MTSRRQPSATATATRAPASQAPKPPCSIHPAAVISDKAIITGVHTVTIGEGCVIHPFAKITSAVAPVRLGKNCIVAERSTVGLISESSAHEGAAVTLEDNVSIETGAVVEATSIGAASVVEVNARISPRTIVGKFCKITPLCHVSGELADYTVAFGEGSRRVDETVKARSDVRDLKIKGHIMHIDALKRLIPSNTARWTS